MAATMGFDLKPAATAAPASVTDIVLAEIGTRGLDGSSLARTADGHLIVPINEVGYVRTDMLGALSGAFELEVVNRRYRGKRTDSLFGGADAAVVAVMGKGHCVLYLGERVPTAPP